MFDNTIDALKQKSQRTQKVTVILKDANQYYKLLKDSYPNINLHENTFSLEVDTKETTNQLMLKLIDLGANIIEIKTNDDLENLFLNLSK